MWRFLNLFTNCFLSSVIFNFYIEILVLLLNPHIQFSSSEFILLYFHLFLFYGPLWFICITLVFIVIQFFSERKYQIGIFKPPTITYFFSFSILIISFILFLNYDYYFEFFAPSPKFIFIRILLINLVLVIIGIVFVFFKRIKKNWSQILFFSLLVIQLLHSYTSVMSIQHAQSFTSKEIKGDKIIKGKFPEEVEPRKIRIIIMDGLSLNIIQRLATEQKLLNFKEILNKGVYGRLRTFQPNLYIAMLNTALTGRKPSEFTLHSNNKFKFTGLNFEFDVWPRYIFFRKSPYITSISFYKKNENHYLDAIDHQYQSNNRKTKQLITPLHIDRFSNRSLKKNNRFIPLFSNLLHPENELDKKYQILKKFFFLDDYIKKIIPDLKDNDIYYTVIHLPGLGVIGKFFYQYYMPHIFGTIQDETKIKKYGWIIEKYYEYYDSIIGNLMSTTGDNELLVILSLYEYEPLPLWRRIIVHLFGQRDVYVYKSISSLGTILLYEKKALKQDYPLKTISIYDIFPTLIYYSGFQLSRDLQGEVLREIFTEDFLLNNPIDINTNHIK